MSLEDILFESEERFEKALTALEHDFRRIRTGRATVSMLEHVQVEAYGAMMSILQLASISVPEPTQLLIKPYDKSSIRDIEKGLIASDLGMAPQNDGEVIRLNVPPLSTERRQQLVGQAKEGTEKSKISLRNGRRDGIKSLETLGKDEKLPEDDVKKAVETISETMKTYEKKAEDLFKIKSRDLTEV